MNTVTGRPLTVGNW